MKAVRRRADWPARGRAGYTPRMPKKVMIEWDGEHLPEELRSVPPGRYLLEVVDGGESLTPEAEQGLRDALDQSDAGQGLSLADVVREIRANSRRP